MSKKKKQYRDLFTKSGDELQEFFAFRKRQGVVPAKKGRGSYRRKPKHKNLDE